MHFTNQKKKTEKTDFALNTFVTVTIYGADPSSRIGASKKTNEELAAEAVSMIHNYEKVFSVTDPDSELYKLNAGELKIGEISDDLAHVIETGVKFGDLTDGEFDITIKPVKDLWDFTGEDPKLPDDDELKHALMRVDYRRIMTDAEKTVSDLQESNSRYEIDLGAIAKGYIADRIKDYLMSEGVKSAIINLGGNVLCIGKNPDGSDFRIGLRNPFSGEMQATPQDSTKDADGDVTASGESTTFAAVSVSDKTVVTSGIYERGFEYEGKWYHHILSPKTGYPIDNGLASVSVICDSSEDADALSTSCFCVGLEKGSELIKQMDAEAYFVKTNGEIVHVGN